MYQYKLRIIIFSKESRWEAAARNVEPQERFQHEIRSFKDFFPEELEHGDIIIWELPDRCNASHLRSRCKRSALIVYCGTASQIGELLPEDMEAFDEIWEKVSDHRLHEFRIRRLLQQIKLVRDLDLWKTYLDTMIDSVPDMVWFKDINGLHLKVNKAFCLMVGKEKEDVTGRDHCYIWNVSHDDPNSGEKACQESEETVIRRQETCQFTEQVKSIHGMRQFRTYKSPLRDYDGSIIGTVGIGHDITDLENLGTELEIFLSSMPFGILICNEKGMIVNANNKFERYFGISKEDVIGQSYDVWSSGALGEPRTINSEGFVEATVYQSGEAIDRTLEIHEEPIYDVFQDMAGQLCVYRDVTTERRLEQQILKNSNTDFLTSLYNRRCFYQYISNNRGEKPITLLYTDLDHFKKVNDTYGHRAGDFALVTTANLLRECFENEFIARIGGDEFLIAMLGERSIKELEEKSQHFLNQARKTFHSTPEFADLSVSIGVAQTRDPSMNIDTLMQQSDAALYKAKENGKDQYCIYTPSFSI